MDIEDIGTYVFNKVVKDMTKKYPNNPQKGYIDTILDICQIHDPCDILKEVYEWVEKNSYYHDKNGKLNIHGLGILNMTNELASNIVIFMDKIDNDEIDCLFD